VPERKLDFLWFVSCIKAKNEHTTQFDFGGTLSPLPLSPIEMRSMTRQDKSRIPSAFSAVYYS
ncbi:MAG: hypothetical protein NC320_07000, partial [Clostridium sp.]|nr:hypothetical protein [Clostridium sp.]MCM1547417.1 hypothetical protein [Ruminococcus sp.]